MTASVWMILTVILLMAVAGVLSTVETAVSAISRARVTEMVRDEVAGAKALAVLPWIELGMFFEILGFGHVQADQVVSAAVFEKGTVFQQVLVIGQMIDPIAAIADLPERVAVVLRG